MPSCPWCGKEYPDGQQFCPVDGKALAGTKAPPEPDSKWRPELIDLSQVDGAFSFEEGFSRPDWKVISQAIQQRITGPDDLKLSVAGSIQPSSRRPNHTSSRPFSIGLRPTDQPARLVVMNKGIPAHMILPCGPTRRTCSPGYSRSSGLPL